MLFNSYIYLLLILPLSLVVFRLLDRAPIRVAFGWLVVMSLVFYGWWNPDQSKHWTPFYVCLILGSCTANYFFGTFLSRHKLTPSGKRALVIGVTANLALLVYYKYTGFFATTLHNLTGWPVSVPQIVLPLAVSFFTFLQIAYLVDAYRGETEEYHFTDYLLFVTFFPHLIAGPIVHHKEMLPQFQTRRTDRQGLNLSVGITFLALGLFKKVVIADNLALTATPIFELAAHGGRNPTFAEAWAAAIAYTLQIYFDFSGYSDMAIGSARIFGVRFPLNFHSPYKAVSVVDFWRRWHVTLSRFLRDYLYIPLGGNRKGKSRRYVNLMLTMVLGGMWHGAGWSYLIWGFLHGFYLCVNHAWAFVRKSRNIPALPKPLAVALTFLAVLLAWIPFRSGSFELGSHGSSAAAAAATKNMLSSMFGLHGFAGLSQTDIQVVKEARLWKLSIVALAMCWILPNTQQFLGRYSPALYTRDFDGKLLGPKRRWHWRPTVPHALLTLGILYVVAREFDKISEFIYFQF